MNDLTLSKEARQRHPYGSLYAALLFQSFEDALAEAMPTDDATDRDAAEAVPRTHRPAPAGRPALAQQA